MSQATTGAPLRLIASIAAAAGSRGDPRKPVPKIASTTAPDPSRRARGGHRPAPRRSAPGSRPRRRSAPARARATGPPPRTPPLPCAGRRPGRRRRCCPFRKRPAPAHPGRSRRPRRQPRARRTPSALATGCRSPRSPSDRWSASPLRHTGAPARAPYNQPNCAPRVGRVLDAKPSATEATPGGSRRTVGPAHRLTRDAATKRRQSACPSAALAKARPQTAGSENPC